MPLPPTQEQQLDYDGWANREILASLRPLPAPPARALALLNHVVGASRLWLARLQGTPSPCAVWPQWTLAQCSAEVGALRERWRRWSAPLVPDALEAMITYTNSKGERYTSRVADVLTHVALHGAHHRGQLLAELRAAGHLPPYVDFIHATRTGALRSSS
ncbi:MAG: damage-inducible protein DinB [Planctomycetes bacterium]|nr:damage-inducible protein DinB [Planctomycetota bacterium]